MKTHQNHEGRRAPLAFTLGARSPANHGGREHWHPEQHGAPGPPNRAGTGCTPRRASTPLAFALGATSALALAGGTLDDR